MPANEYPIKDKINAIFISFYCVTFTTQHFVFARLLYSYYQANYTKFHSYYSFCISITSLTCTDTK